MMRRLAAFILILGSLQGFLSLEIKVFQVPEVHATPSSDVTLQCSYNISGFEDTTIGSYKWYRHQVKPGTEVSDNNKDFFGRISRTDASEFISKRIAHLTIHNVDSSHAGIYFCQVTFQHGKEISGHGNGTLLNVTDDSQKTFSICILVKVAGFLLIVLTGLIASFCTFRFRPTILNHFNQHSGSPRGACGSPAVLTQSLS
ncbi:natural cytotoxicity triggering receptor 3-like [Eleutherodactylus coqui]|uniref:natural cytotoxicity triggering receptor 3-like n=1 Tax=Eleutherodactylus coqui TaxID=57060 RepID=UPI0034637F8A